MSAESVETDEAEIHEEEEKVSNLAEQALWVLIHMLLALGSWGRRFSS
jgi:hypothetical protein